MNLTDPKRDQLCRKCYLLIGIRRKPQPRNTHASSAGHKRQEEFSKSNNYRVPGVKPEGPTAPAQCSGGSVKSVYVLRKSGLI